MLASRAGRQSKSWWRRDARAAAGTQGHAGRDVSARGDDIFSAGRCMGMIEGTSYLTPNICAPAGATTSQRLQVIVSYIEARPARMNEDFRSLALEAMEQ